MAVKRYVTPATAAHMFKGPIGGRPSPSSSAAAFVNTRASGLMNGTSAEVGGATPQPVGMVDPAVGGANMPTDNSVASSARRRMQSVKDSTARLTQYASLKKAQQVAAKPAQGGGGGVQPAKAKGGVAVRKPSQKSAPVQGNMSNAGKAYQNDGKLSAVRNQVIRDASQYIGTQYVLGGRSTKGIDCSGLIMNVYNKLGYKLPHHSGVQSRTIPGVRTSLSNLRPGDIVAWKDGSHIGIYAGNGYIIDAANRQIDTSKRKINMNRGDVYGIALRLPGE